MNLSGLLSIFDQLSVFEQVVSSLASEGQSAETVPLHLRRAIRPPVLAKLYEKTNRPILFLTGRVDAVAAWEQSLETWLPPQTHLLRFPEPTPLPYDRAPWSDNSRMDRMSVLTRLMAGQHPLLPEQPTVPLIMTSARALLQKTIPKRKLLTSIKVLKVGQIINLEKTLKSWNDIGYTRATVVEEPCQFSHRGGILDIYPSTSAYPVRIELFGDEVDTMRYFDPATQRSVAGDASQIVVAPAREALPSMAAAVGETLSAEADPKYDDLPAWQDDLPDLVNGTAFPYLEYYLPQLYGNAGSLLDYLPKDTLLVVDDWVELTAAVRDLQGRAAQMANEQNSLPPNMPSPIFSWEQMAAKLTAQSVLVLGEISEDPEPPAEDAPLELADLMQPGPRHGGQEREFTTQLSKAKELEQRTIVVSRQAQRLTEIWRGNKQWSTIVNASPNQLRPLSSLPHLPKDGSLTFVNGALGEGFILEDERGTVLLNLLTDVEIFGWNRPQPRRRKVKRAVAPEAYFSDIEPGDFVVHIEYGVGQFMGMVARSIGGADREYLQINYANTDVLYIPVHHADRLSKWMGSEFNKPNMHRVGEKSWTKAKKQAQEAINELADELLELYAARESISGHAFSADNEWQAELEASFPHTETEDQLKAIEAVKDDMELPRPMDRLICGDVGFGKTEVALRAAFKAVMDGKQVAILVPTTVLAQQHFNTFHQRLTSFPVEVGLLSRFRTPTQNSETVKQLRAGAIDVVIGTHRLLSDDVTLKDLGLLIIDEEQRFGVSHKETLKKLRTEVDVLTMTATPIPRTLYMGLSGLRDISVIETPPNERLPIQTYVGTSDSNLIKKAILRELDRGGQIFFVHNHVQTIDNAFKTIQALVPDARIAIGHGQMGEGELEKVMTQFATHEIDILICTTIIESGLDIPNANTVILDRAELFGLSQMYQLRGRVGRGTQRAYAYFFHAPWRQITPEARARLETIDEHQELGAGYSIAMRDLEIRGAGDLLGGSQSGHIGAVGFDLYMRMLQQAVRARKAALKGEKISAELPLATTIDLPLAAYIPTDYVPDPALRLRLYRRMAGLATLAEIDDVSAELSDRFGGVPDPLNNLLFQLRIKNLMRSASLSSISTENQQVRIRKSNLEFIDRYHLQRFLGEAVRVSKTAIWLQPGLSTNEWKIVLVQVLERLSEFEGNPIAA